MAHTTFVSKYYWSKGFADGFLGQATKKMDLNPFD